MRLAWINKYVSFFVYIFRHLFNHAFVHSFIHLSIRLSFIFSFNRWFLFSLIISLLFSLSGTTLRCLFCISFHFFWLVDFLCWTWSLELLLKISKDVESYRETRIMQRKRLRNGESAPAASSLMVSLNMEFHLIRYLCADNRLNLQKQWYDVH